MTTEALAVVPAPAPLAVAGRLEFSPDQQKMIRDTYANGASESDFTVLMEIAKARALNPLLKQIHFVQRWDNQKGAMKWAVQVAIDGLRAIAQRTQLYDGQDEPEFTYSTGSTVHTGTPPVLCKVKVYRKDVGRPFVGVAHFAEYKQTKKDGTLTQFWREKPHIMLAKCAEALAFRKAFPEDTAGLYVPEEMAERGADAEPSKPPSPAMTKVREGIVEIIAPTKATPPADLETTLAASVEAGKARADASGLVPTPKAEPPHDPVTGEVHDLPPTAEQEAMFDKLMERCSGGFKHVKEADNWGKKHAAEISDMLTETQRNMLRAAFSTAKQAVVEEQPPMPVAP